MCRVRCVVCLMLLSPVVAAAADWPEWRGRQRNGVAQDSPPLATTWPEEGPKRVWVSEAKILSGTVHNYLGGGWGSVSVADGNAYCSYVAPRMEKLVTRTLSEKGLASLGWTAEKPPADILASSEAARLSPERQALETPADILAWAGRWTEANLTADQRKQFGPHILERLRRGESAVSIELLDKLAAVQGKPFASQAELDAWLTANKVEGEVRKHVQAQFPATERNRDTVVLCMDATSGKTVWEKTFTGGLFYRLYENAAASGTPCIANGKVYLLGTLVEAFCLDAKTGKKIWSARIGKMPRKDAHSSFIVVDGVAAVCAEPFTGFDAETGRVLWTHDLIGPWSCPVLWRQDGKAYLIARVGNSIVCVEARSGTMLWKTKDFCGGWKATCSGIPLVLEGDRLLVADQESMRLFKLWLEKPEQLWRVVCPAERCCGPTIYKGHAYLFAGRRGATCVNIETGNVMWEDKSLKAGMYHTPLIADGKVFLNGAGKKGQHWGDGSLSMVAISPEKGVLLAQAKIGQELCVSAAVADGRIYCRLKDRIACYDLRAKQD